MTTWKNLDMNFDVWNDDLEVQVIEEAKQAEHEQQL